MPLIEMPNGEYVDIAEGASAEAIEKVKSRFTPKASTAAPKRAVRTAAGTPMGMGGRRTVDLGIPKGLSEAERSEARIQHYAKKMRGPEIPVLSDLYRGVESWGREAGFHTDEPVAAALGAAFGGAGSYGRGAVKRDFKERREAAHRYRDFRSQESPVASKVGGITGMVVNPLGGVAGTAIKKAGLYGLGKAAQVAPRVLQPAVQAATKVGAAASPLVNSVIGRGAQAGAAQAGLSTFADTGDVGEAGESALGGAVLGAGASAVLGKAAPALFRAVKDRGTAEAPRVAYDKIAAMLARGQSDARTAVGDIASAKASGTPAVLADALPEMTATRASLMRDTRLPSQPGLATEAADRLADAPNRFEKFVRKMIEPKTGQNALTLRSKVHGERKAQAQKDYAEGGLMDTPIKYDPELAKIIRGDTKQMSAVVRRAAEAAGDRRRPWPQGKEFTWRMFDDIKKELDHIVESGTTLSATSGRPVQSTAAQTAQDSLKLLKSLAIKNNPEYEAAIARQRNGFEKLESIQKGRDFIDSIAKRPRELLEELTSKRIHPEEARTGFVDALLSIRNTVDNPVAMLRKWEKNPDQRAILEHVLGGPENVNRFLKFARHEFKAQAGDKAATHAANNPHINDIAEDADVQELIEAGRTAGSGAAFGGVLGFGTGSLRALNKLGKGMSTHAKEALLRELGGEGKGLEEGVAAAKAERAARLERSRKLARASGRVAGGVTASVVSGGAREE